jgi:hypothetical protein
MRDLHKAGLVVCGLLLLAAGAAHAGDQNICAKVSLSGFTPNIVIGYRVTDLLANYHQCGTGSSSNCSTCAPAKSYPKNVGNYLCLPNGSTYSISQSCQALLNKGLGDCTNNIIKKNICGPFQATILPVCNWRTNNNINEADWNWSLTLNGSTVVVDCSQNNFLGPEN